MYTFQILLYFTVFGIKVNAQFGMDKIMDKNSYGPFSSYIKNFVRCPEENKKKGPSSKRMPISTYNLTTEGDVAIMHATVHQGLHLKKCQNRIMVYSIAGKNHTKLFEYDFKNVCSDFPVGPIIRRELRLNEDCYLRKGSYTTKANVPDLCYKFTGGKTFYGEYLLKALIVCNGQTFVCSHTTIVAEKIDKRH